MKKQFLVFVKDSALLFKLIYVGAGVRGMQVEIAPDGLIGKTGALTGKLV